MKYQAGDILLDKYLVEKMVGEGAFGQVYCVTHIELSVRRAIKILCRDMPGVGSTAFNETQERFKIEAQLGANLHTPVQHPNLIHVYDYHHEGDLLLLVMEYAVGGSLAQRIATNRKQKMNMPLEEALPVVMDISRGLAVLHECDYVHRDLKPSNVLFDGVGRAKVADLGLAQIPHGPSRLSQLSSREQHPGTPAYMSPEQETTSNYLKPPSDIYTLGLLVFEMLTGRVYRNVEPGTRLSAMRPDAPQWLDDLLQRMLDKDPENRPWDGSKMVTALLDGETKQKELKKAEEIAPEVEVSEKGVTGNSSGQDLQQKKDPSNRGKERVKTRSTTRDGWLKNAIRKLAQRVGKIDKRVTAGFLGLVVVILLFIFLKPILPSGDGSQKTLTAAGEELETVSALAGQMASKTSEAARSTPTPSVTLTKTLRPSRTATPTLTAVPLSAILYEEDFEDGNIEGWESYYSTWTIEEEDGNRYWHGTGPGPDTYPQTWYVVDEAESWTDYAFESRVRFIKGAIFICVRSLGGSSFYSAAISSDDWIHLADYKNHEYKTFTERSYSIQTNRWYTMRVEVQGEDIRLFIDNILVASGSKSSHEQGDVGYYLGGDEAIEIDDIKIWKLQ